MSVKVHKPTMNAAHSQSQPITARSAACGKAIIVGEHGVVYGASAIAMPVRSMGIELSLCPQKPADSKDYKLLLGGHEVSEQISDLIPEALRLLGKNLFPMTIRGSSTIPIGAGLGSSATLCVGILKVILASLGETPENHRLANLANIMEARFHGNPSGLDTAVIANESCIKFTKGTGPVGLELSTVANSWRFVLVDSKIRAGTRTMIEKALPYFTGRHGDRNIAHFDAISRQAESGLALGHLPTLADAMNEAAEQLDQAGVVPPAVAKMISDCRSLGIPAAKTTGAGGGGTILCLLSTANADSQLAALVKAFGPQRLRSTTL